MTGASGVVNATTAYSTLESGEPNHAWESDGEDFPPLYYVQSSLSGSVWYKWTPPTTASVATVRLQPSKSLVAGLDPDNIPNLVLTLYEDTGSLSKLKLAVIDHVCDVYAASGTDAGSTGQTCVSVAPGGRTFALQVAFESPVWGAFDLVFSTSTTPAMSNDHFAGRTSVSALTPSSSGSRTGEASLAGVLLRVVPLL